MMRKQQVHPVERLKQWRYIAIALCALVSWEVMADGHETSTSDAADAYLRALEGGSLPPPPSTTSTPVVAQPAEQQPTGWLERLYLHSFQRGYQDLRAMLTPDVLDAAGGEECLVEQLKPFFQVAPPNHFLNKLMRTNIRLKGANLILVKVDKMTSAHGLLALPPMFSKRIVEAAMRCPPALKLAGANEKNILKLAVQDILPQPIIERPKSGMRVPVSFWFRGEMRSYARKLLSPRKLKRTGLFNPDYVKHLLAYDREGNVPGLRHGLKLWMLTTFMLWHERMLG
ncbi:MAG: asparagine synthase-related protein [Pseudomonadota bacterium]